MLFPGALPDREGQDSLPTTPALAPAARTIHRCRAAADFQSWGLDSLGNWAGFTDQGVNPDPLDQYVWDIRYVDAPVVRFHDGNTDGDYNGGTQEGDNVLYYTQDAN